MATPGRIVAALASGSQETTIALANINFDFSLIKAKLDAPASFQGVGTALSRKRKEAAESGSSHVTARKLGALFDQILPNTPILIERYGLRASEIAQSLKKEEHPERTYGMFAEQAGVDATSIWAAATSGESAIAVHLLACMLAKIFPSAEATSIWAELIEERKKELACGDFTRPTHISTVLAAHISLSRDQLAEWDNSARSWVRAADEAKSTQQTQLMLIIKNIHVPVNKIKGSLYASVMSAWKRALELMESLFRGAAQRITPYESNGDLLLALASWHVYPDMDVLGRHKISQKDPLMPLEAILTVGLECPPAQQDSGVYWSLPLAHYRFYGPPKNAEHSLCTDTERLSFEQFGQVALGCFLWAWDNDGNDIIDCVELLVRMYDFLTADQEIDEVNQVHDATHDNPRPTHLSLLRSAPNLLKYLAESGRLFLESNMPNRATYNRLIRLGMRRGRRFLDEQPPFLGLYLFNDFLGILNSTEHKIQALRRLADRLNIDAPNALIRYRNSDFHEDRTHRDQGYSNPPNVPGGHVETVVVGSTSPLKTRGSLRSPEPENDDSNTLVLKGTASEAHVLGQRRVDPSTVGVEDAEIEQDSHYLENHVPCTAGFEDAGNAQQGTHRKWVDPFMFVLHEDQEAKLDLKTKTTFSKGKIIRVPVGYYSYASLIPQSRTCVKGSYDGTETKSSIHKRWVLLDGGRKQLFCLPDEEILGLDQIDIQCSTSSQIYLAGDRNISLITSDTSGCDLFDWHRSWRLHITLDDITWALECGAFDRLRLAEFLASDAHLSQAIEMETYRAAQQALATVFDIYGQFSRATVALKIIESPLLSQKWIASCHASSVGGHHLDNDSFDGSDSDIDGFYSDTDGSGRATYSFRQGTANSDNNGFYRDKIDLEHHKTRSLAGLSPLDLTRGETFALLAVFETGYLNLHPSTLSKVMAMSAGDSIFVATQLLTDPLESQDLRPSSICRIRGNIGKPGVVMLISPPKLQVKPRNSADWAVINHTPFDGELVDSFRGTSLHLSFSEYSRALDTGVHGGRDAETYFLEAYVQIYFRSQWIGDADIISTLESRYFNIYDPDSRANTSCEHGTEDMRTSRVVSIDNWDEFVDNPKGGIIVRAKDNWLARLAAATLSAQRKDKTIVLRGDSRIC